MTARVWFEVRLPLVPVTVNIALPGATQSMCKVTLPAPPVTIEGDNVPVATPAALDWTLRATVPVNPFCAVTVIVDVFEVSPTLHVKVTGCAETMKPGAAVTVNGISTE